MLPRMLMSRGFARSARKLRLTARSLTAAVREIDDGLIDVRLGGYLLKKRIVIAGRGKNTGVRTIVVHRQDDRLIFLYAFDKKECENITEREYLVMTELGAEYMKIPAEQIESLVGHGAVLEISHDDQTKI